MDLNEEIFSGEELVYLKSIVPLFDFGFGFSSLKSFKIEDSVKFS